MATSAGASPDDRDTTGESGFGTVKRTIPDRPDVTVCQTTDHPAGEGSRRHPGFFRDPPDGRKIQL